MGTGYFDKYNHEVNIGNELLLNNASRYKVVVTDSQMLLQCLSNDNVPQIKLSKVTYGKWIYLRVRSNIKQAFDMMIKNMRKMKNNLQSEVTFIRVMDQILGWEGKVFSIRRTNSHSSIDIPFCLRLIHTSRLII